MGWFRSLSIPIRFFRLPNTQKRLLLEAAACLCAAQAAVRLIPFRWLAPALGAQHREPSPVALSGTAETGADYRGVSTAIRLAARRLPWNPTCLARAIAAKAMLGLRGARSTLYLGVAKDGSDRLMAHAWLEAEGTILTGGAESEGFEAIASFS